MTRQRLKSIQTAALAFFLLVALALLVILTPGCSSQGDYDAARAAASKQGDSAAEAAAKAAADLDAAVAAGDEAAAAAARERFEEADARARWWADRIAQADAKMKQASGPMPVMELVSEWWPYGLAVIALIRELRTRRAIGLLRADRNEIGDRAEKVIGGIEAAAEIDPKLRAILKKLEPIIDRVQGEDGKALVKAIRKGAGTIPFRRVA